MWIDATGGEDEMRPVGAVETGGEECGAGTGGVDSGSKEVATDIVMWGS